MYGFGCMDLNVDSEREEPLKGDNLHFKPDWKQIGAQFTAV